MPRPVRRKGPALRTGPARAGFALAPARPGHGLGGGVINKSMERTTPHDLFPKAPQQHRQRTT